MSVKLAMVIYATKHDMHNLRLFLVSADTQKQPTLRIRSSGLFVKDFFCSFVEKKLLSFCFEQNEAIIFFLLFAYSTKNKELKEQKSRCVSRKTKRNTVLEIASKFLISNSVSDELFQYFD